MGIEETTGVVTRRRSARVAIAVRIVLVCLALSAMEATQSYFAAQIKGEPSLTFARELVASLPTWLSVAVLTPFIFALTRSFPLEFTVSRATLVHLVSSALFPFVHIAVAMVGWYWLYMRFEPNFDSGARFARVTVSHYVMEVLIYWLVAGVYASWSYRERYLERKLEAARLRAETAQLQASLSEARLGALRSQLNPHFLFNTLNAITVLAEEKNFSSVFAMTKGLAKLLRSSLERDEQTIPLSDELALTHEYLAIEQIRFGPRLSIAWDVDPDALGEEVPTLVLQPLIENALKHGVGKSPDSVEVEVAVRRERDALVVAVADSGPGIVGGAAAIVEGVGLKNTRARLAQLYGARASMRVSTRSAGGFEVIIRIPIENVILERIEWQNDYARSL